MSEKIVQERCIGYQNGRDGLEAVIEQKLENGMEQWYVSKTVWEGLTVYEMPTLPLTTKPRIDVTSQELEDRLWQARKTGENT